MGDDGASDCCRCCCSFIFTSGLTALFLWLSLRTHNPSCSLPRLYLPPLNLSATAADRANRTFQFDLYLHNSMKDKGVHYANITLSFFYVRNGSRLPVANYTAPAFYQGHGKTAKRKNLTAVANAMPWADAIKAVNGSTVTFRVDLVTRVKFKILFWYTKRQKLAVGSDAEVDGSGGTVKKKKIKLKSGARIRARVGLVVLLTLFTNLLL